MKDIIRCFGCGKEIDKPKRIPKTKIGLNKSSCDPRWIKDSFMEDEEKYYFLYCPKCRKLSLESSKS